jgi:hypothetical protein
MTAGAGGIKPGAGCVWRLLVWRDLCDRSIHAVSVEAGFTALRCPGPRVMHPLTSTHAPRRHPGLFDSVLIESPSLWLAEENFLWKDIAGAHCMWPARM